MTVQFSPQRNPRVIIIQKLYGKLYNNEENISFPKHRFKKFIKDIVNGTIEREELINAEIDNHLNQDLKIKNMDKVFQIIIKSAIFELLYKPNTSIKIIINEYLKASNFFIDDSQTKYLNALLDKISKKIRISNE
jgi:N utilization substance protein B|tara:strand:+ start:181 stop:585 length:405 start_codon:yes stop_codon:yes gene_type:complete